MTPRGIIEPVVVQLATETIGPIRRQTLICPHRIGEFAGIVVADTDRAQSVAYFVAAGMKQLRHKGPLRCVKPKRAPAVATQMVDTLSIAEGSEVDRLLADRRDSDNGISHQEIPALKRQDSHAIPSRQRRARAVEVMLPNAVGNGFLKSAAEEGFQLGRDRMPKIPAEHQQAQTAVTVILLRKPVPRRIAIKELAGCVHGIADVGAFLERW